MFSQLQAKEVRNKNRRRRILKAFILWPTKRHNYMTYEHENEIRPLRYDGVM
jgi:hypothetical protein